MPTRRSVLGLSGGAALIGALGGDDPSALPSPQQQEGRGGIAAIDAHVHVVTPRIPGMKPMPEDVRRLMDGPPEAMAGRLNDEMARAGVEFALGMGCLGGPEDDPLGIDGTLRLATSVPGLRAIGIADPTRTEPGHLRAVERQIERERGRLVALKAYLGYLHFGPEHANYAPYYRLAAKYGLPVVFHTGDNWSTKAKLRYAHPLGVDEAAVDHPDVKFVMAHFGNPWLIDAAEVVFKNDNVWADLSGLYVGDEKAIDELLNVAGMPEAASGLMISDLKKALAYTERPDRLLYGSDWPLAPMPAYRRLIEVIIPKKHHEAVFRTNAERLFGLGG